MAQWEDGSTPAFPGDLYAVLICEIGGPEHNASIVKRLPTFPVLAAFCSLLFSSCETTTDYGYYVGGALDVRSIETLFAISDEAIREMDYNTYSGLLAPGFTTVDKTDGVNQFTARTDYLDLVDELFSTAEYVEVVTMIMDVEFIEPGRRALVTVQEEERREQFGNPQHFTSMSEIEVGFEDGWAFFEKSTRIAEQIIDD